MLFKISNGVIEVTVSSLGAELMSIKSVADGTEYLWQGDKAFWGGRAYNLFPICGRLTEGRYIYRGREYEMTLHGFVRKSELDATPLGPDKIDFGLRADENTAAVYPFDFEYHILYTLEGGKIRMDISVANHGSEVMPFALGGHPGFNVPLVEGEAFEDYYLEFTPECAPRSLVMSDTCYITGESRDFPLEKGRRLPMRHSLFDRDAILLGNVSHKAALKSLKSRKQVTVEFPDAMKYLSIWHTPKTEAPFVAVEPWTSVPAYEGVIDDLTAKRDMLELAPQGVYELSWSIGVEE